MARLLQPRREPPLWKITFASYRISGIEDSYDLLPREREILQLVAEGKSNKEIANSAELLASIRWKPIAAATSSESSTFTACPS
jgi:DNA-binding NarL/FixJ family response regulator